MCRYERAWGWERGGGEGEIEIEIERKKKQKRSWRRASGGGEFSSVLPLLSSSSSSSHTVPVVEMFFSYLASFFFILFSRRKFIFSDCVASQRAIANKFYSYVFGASVGRRELRELEITRQAARTSRVCILVEIHKSFVGEKVSSSVTLLFAHVVGKAKERQGKEANWPEFSRQ